MAYRLSPFALVALLLGTSVRASEERLRADVETLAGEIGPRSVFQGDSLQRAADFITGRFQALGWDVHCQSYPVNGRMCENLEVERRGTTHPGEIVLIGAHYDTVPSTPGADDNASGVAVLLALAEVFVRAEPQKTLRLV